MTYVEQVLFLNVDALDCYVRVAVALKINAYETHEKSGYNRGKKTTNLDFPCLRPELWFEVVPIP